MSFDQKAYSESKSTSELTAELKRFQKNLSELDERHKCAAPMYERRIKLLREIIASRIGKRK